MENVKINKDKFHALMGSYIALENAALNLACATLENVSDRVLKVKEAVSEARKMSSIVHQNIELPD